jgi:hypothetical protein
MHIKSKRSSWQKFFDFWTASPLRLGSLVILVIVIVSSGILRILLDAFVRNVFEPLLIAALLFAIILYVVNPSRRK